MDSKEQLEQKLLQFINTNEVVENTMEFVNFDIPQHQALVSVIKSLEVAYCVVSSPVADYVQYNLSDEANLIVEQGSHEARFFALIDPVNGSQRDELLAQMGEYGKFAMGACMKNKWVKQDKAGLVTRVVESIVDTTRLDLQQIKDLKTEDKIKANAALFKSATDLKKRKLLDTTSTKYFKVVKGEKFSLVKKEYIADLDIATLKSKAWETTEFKDYNFAAEGRVGKIGSLHPLQKIKIEFTKILTNMGFQEMKTNQYVESSFWNFDTLFQPQQHPARDAHDTFFLSSPELCDMERTAPKEYIKAVKDVHEIGGYGSVGYHYDWSADEAAKNILRTHTTANSSRTLYDLAQEHKAKVAAAKAAGQPEPEFTPRRFFSIDRVFRNETLDATHLAEFHQVEGMIVAKDLTLGHLIAVIRTFFQAIGVDDVKFKPAFNPYTEPSMEIFGYSKELGRWIELGNSGVFRPEMTEPMGIPRDVKVIAWGLSLERPTMIKYGLKNIRELVGPKMQLKIIEKNPIARYP
eukprot:UN00216